MVNTNHPDDERLAAFAGADAEAAGDSSLTAHVASCTRCAAIVSELRSLTAALSSLPDPDLVPPRTLQLIPPVPPGRPSVADRAAEIMRRLFAPALTAGAALVLVGAVGTGLPPALQGAASGPDAGGGLDAAAEASFRVLSGASEEAAPSASAIEAESSARAADTFLDSGSEAQVGGATAAPGVTGFTEEAQGREPAGGDGEDELAADNRAADADSPVARQIWPMVLFSGVALIILALLGRWVLGARPA